MRNLIGLGIGGFAGLLVGLMALPPRALDLHDTGWLSGDLWQVFQAWQVYLEAGTWPLLTTDRLSYPLSLPIALFDPMPLFLWLAAALQLPRIDGSVQLFGYYFLLCCVLQGLFGALLVGELLGARVARLEHAWLYVALGGAIIAALPFTMWRFPAHTALSSQWVVVLATWVAFRTRGSATVPWLASNAAVCFLASGINPYLTLMACMPPAILAVHRAWRRELSPGLGLLRLACLVAAPFFGFWLFGFLGGVGGTGGYGYYSMNMLGPLDSNGLGVLWRLDISDATGGQGFEGFTFLGAGLLALLLVSLWRSPHPIPPVAAPVLLIALAGYLLALSDVVTFGSAGVVQIPFLEQVLGRFRSSGRFFWIGGIVLAALAVAVVAARRSPRGAVLIIAGCTILQAIDVTRIALSVRESINNNARLTSDVVLPEGVTTLAVIPPWQCGPDDSVGGRRGYELVGDVVVRYGVRTNSYYAARTPDDHRDYHCNPDNWIPDGPDLATLALLIADTPAALPYLAEVGATHACRSFPDHGGYHACVPRSGATD